jgi:hypothetical protein
VGLANTTHTLGIEVTGRKNPASTSANKYIVVDAFDVPAPTVTRVQETDPSLTFSAGWAVFGQTSQQWSGGTARVADTGGPQVTFTFTGTAVAWVGLSADRCGIARVVLDGVALPEVDTYSNREVFFGVQAEVFRATNLPSGSHTLTIEATGRRNPAATGTMIVVDAFEVTQ